MKYFIIRTLLRLLTVRYQVFTGDDIPVPVPEKFKIFENICPENVVQQVVAAYIQVFSEPPWNETHSPQCVSARLQNEIQDGFLTTMSSFSSIIGFSWGAVIPTKSIQERVLRTRPDFKANGQLMARIISLGKKNILFYDEFAILSKSRGGLSPIQFLLRPGLEYAYIQGVKSLLFWTSWKSNIASLAVYMGFEPVCESNGIVFLLNRDFTPLLKITQNLSSREIAKLMKFTSKL